MQSTREQINSLTGLRGVAATWVMLMHFREITPTRVWEFPILDTLVANGAYGVDIFFVLSGFILCHVYAGSFRNGLSSDQIRQFMLYRLARIYPVHLATFAVMLVLLLVAKLMTSGSEGISERYDPLTIVMTLVLMHAWIPGMQTPNMPAWSISAEWFAYILFPALCFFLSYSKWIPALYVAAGLGLAFFQPFDHYPLSHVLSGFLIGMAAYRTMSAARWIKIGRASGLGVAAAIAYWAQAPAPRMEIGLLLFAMLIMTLVDSRDLLSRFLSLPAIVYLGEISYSLYMVHWPVRVIIRSALQMLHLLDNLPSAVVVCAFVFVALIGAMASYHFVELPGRALLRRALTRFQGMSGVSAATAGPS
jgi:peptidoglycan/LPS O-acetylase OafA/YrhL